MGPFLADICTTQSVQMSVHKILDPRCSHQLMARPTSQVFSDHEAGGLLTNHSLIQAVIGCHSLGSFENSEGESRRLIFAGNVIAVRPGASVLAALQSCYAALLEFACRFVECFFRDVSQLIRCC